LYLALIYLNPIQTQEKKDSHAVLLALAYLGGGLRRSNIAMMRLANMLQGYKSIFILYATYMSDCS